MDEFSLNSGNSLNYDKIQNLVCSPKVLPVCNKHIASGSNTENISITTSGQIVPLTTLSRYLARDSNGNLFFGYHIKDYSFRLCLDSLNSVKVILRKLTQTFNVGNF